jgi:hypothetical protein
MFPSHKTLTLAFLQPTPRIMTTTMTMPLPLRKRTTISGSKINWRASTRMQPVVGGASRLQRNRRHSRHEDTIHQHPKATPNGRHIADTIQIVPHLQSIMFVGRLLRQVGFSAVLLRGLAILHLPNDSGRLVAHPICPWASQSLASLNGRILVERPRCLTHRPLFSKITK